MYTRSYEPKHQDSLAAEETRAHFGLEVNKALGIL